MPLKHRGHTLFELLMTLALVGVVFGLGLPAFGGLLADKRLRVETDALFHAVHVARKASITRRRVISLCPSTDGVHCAAVDAWSTGWIMFENDARQAAGTREDHEKLLDYHTVDPSVRLRANRAHFAFRSTHLRATNGTIAVCDRAGRARARALVVSYTGRPRVAIETPRGQPYSCAD